jgi:hypothetical protein
MSGFVFNVWFPPDMPDEEPTLFDRREDAERYAALFADAKVEEVAVMDQGLAASFIAEANSEIEEDR